MRAIRRALDTLYLASGVAASLCLIAILLLILVQMLARWTGEVFPGAPAYVAYAMASASFLAFAHALNRGSHIRVSIVLNRVGPRTRWAIELWCFGVATAITWYFVYFAIRFVNFSIMINDISQEQDKTPLWMPQTIMVIGAIILAIAVTDNLISLLVTGKHRIQGDTIEMPSANAASKD